MSFFVYILASKRNGTLYIGMTDDLARRVWEHQSGAIPGFTKKYGVKTLVWYEVHESRETAFQRERQLKKWNRAWKLKVDRALKSKLARSRPRISVKPGFPPSRESNAAFARIWVPAFAGTRRIDLKPLTPV